MGEWPSGKVSATVCKFNAYFLYITGRFRLHWAVISLSNTDDTIKLLLW